MLLLGWFVCLLSLRDIHQKDVGCGPKSRQGMVGDLAKSLMAMGVVESAA